MEEKGFVYILYWHILIHKGAINLTEQKAAIRLLTQSSAKVWNYSEDSRNCHALYIVSLRKSCLIISNLTPTYMFAPLELLRELIYPINRSVVAQLFSAAKEPCQNKLYKFSLKIIVQSSFHQKDCSGYFDTSPQR